MTLPEFPVFRPTKCQAKGCENEINHPGNLVCDKCADELEGWLELLSVGQCLNAGKKPKVALIRIEI